MKKFISFIILFAMIGISVNAAIYNCYSCPAGYYCPNGEDKYLCSAGTFSQPGQTSCFTCPAGQYQPNSGQSGCIVCPSEQVEACNYTYESCYTYTGSECGDWSKCIAACAFAPFPASLVCDKNCPKCKKCENKTANGTRYVSYEVNSSRTACEAFVFGECK